jgi:hypothetical protein
MKKSNILRIQWNLKKLREHGKHLNFGGTTIYFVYLEHDKYHHLSE